MKNLLVFIICLSTFNFLAQNAVCQEIDSGFISKNNQFLKDLLSRKQVIDPITAPHRFLFTPNHILFAEKEQLLIKTENNFYLTLIGTGVIYQLTKQTDSLLFFKRIDKTYNINYNFDAKWFCVREDLYNLGGYGFWKSNGTLRKFNFKDKEWDVQPTTEEIFTPAKSQYVWYDQDSSIYTPFQQVINAGLIVNNSLRGSIEKNVYKLNLHSSKWTKLGDLTPDLSQKIDESPWVITTKEGYLLIGHENLYLLDFKKNEVRVLSNASIAQTFLRLNETFLKYQVNNKFYTLNNISGDYDSLPLNTKTFALASFPIWDQPINYYKIFGFVLLAFFVIAIFFYYSKRKSSIKSKYEHHRNFKVNFNETETGLIKLLLDKASSNTTATILEINYIIGVKDKNVGMQKKVRSDIINSINEKYRYHSTNNEPMIQSIRSEEDKRYFEYLIKNELHEEINRLIP